MCGTVVWPHRRAVDTQQEATVLLHAKGIKSAGHARIVRDLNLRRAAFGTFRQISG